MIYHPTARERFGYLLILAICAGLILASVFFFFRTTGAQAKQFGESIVVTSLLLLAAVYVNWLSWSAIVRVQEQGVSWSEGKNSGSLAWDNIAGFGWKIERRFMKAGLVDKSSRELRLLPFLSPALYAALRDRCGRLPAEQEKLMGLRS